MQASAIFKQNKAQASAIPLQAFAILTIESRKDLQRYFTQLQFYFKHLQFIGSNSAYNQRITIFFFFLQFRYPDNDTTIQESHCRKNLHLGSWIEKIFAKKSKKEGGKSKNREEKNVARRICVENRVFVAY